MARCKTGMVIQSIMFDSDKWSPSRARRWLAGHGAKAPKADITKNYIRYRQAPTLQFKAGSFRTKTLDSPMGIKAVVACPNSKYRSNPLPQIIAMNPRRKRKSATKKRTTKGGLTMARRRKRTVKRKPARRRRNPSRSRSSAMSYARQTIGGVNIIGAFREAIPLMAGAVLAKFAAKKFAEGGGEMEEWSWKNILAGLAGALVGGIASSVLLKSRGNIAQKVFLGGMVIVLYKIFTQKIAPQNATLSAWFSGDESYPDNSEYGEIWQGDETDYMTGADGLYRPIDEGHRLPEIAGYGDVVTPATPMFGDVVVPATPKYGGFGGTVVARETTNVFQKAYS